MNASNTYCTVETKIREYNTRYGYGSPQKEEDKESISKVGKQRRCIQYSTN
jgi:hypothetical protein